LQRRTPFHLRDSSIFAALVILAGGVVALAYALHHGSGRDSFRRSLADALINLAILGLVGALITALVAWQARGREEMSQRQQQRVDFLRRLAGANQRVQVARRLIDTHDSARTYSEQLRALIATRASLEDLREDLRFADGLFNQQEQIGQNIEQLITYLERGEDEWNRHKLKVDSEWERARSAKKIFRNLKISWVVDFIEGDNAYKSDYEAHLIKAKSTMRDGVYSRSRV
jgi:pimeloyl-ACP methyl ester carboxylesterase